MELDDSIFFEQNLTLSPVNYQISLQRIEWITQTYPLLQAFAPVHLPNPDSGNNVFRNFQPPEPDLNSTQDFSNDTKNQPQGFPNTTVKIGFIEDERINRANTFQFNLCGVPGVCNPNAQSLCLNTKLRDCQACDDGASVCFIFLILCLGLAILIGNALILFATAQMRKKKTANIVHWYKASLAVADLLTGLQIFFVVFPNFAWTLNSTMSDIHLASFTSHNSPQAVAGGFVYLLSFTSSLYHLLLFGIMRLYAIKWPFQYRQQTKQTIYVSLGIVWGLAAVVASFPAWFPTRFSFDYYHVIFLYLPSLTINSLLSSFTAGILSFVILLLTPFVLMTLISIATAILVRLEVKSSQKRLGQAPGEAKKDSFTKQEVAAFKCVTLMQIGFSVTLVPLCVAVVLLYSSYFTCENFSTSYMTCFYVTMTNSLVNVLVYSVREKKFRSSVGDIFRRCKLNVISKEISSSSKSTATSKAKGLSSGHSPSN